MLEFTCDFVQQCQETQIKMSSSYTDPLALQNDSEEKVSTENEDSDKENALPIEGGNKRAKSAQSELPKILQDVEQDENLAISQIAENGHLQQLTERDPLADCSENEQEETTASALQAIPVNTVQKKKRRTYKTQTLKREIRTRRKTYSCKLNTLDKYINIEPTSQSLQVESSESRKGVYSKNQKIPTEGNDNQMSKPVILKTDSNVNIESKTVEKQIEASESLQTNIESISRVDESIADSICEDDSTIIDVCSLSVEDTFLQENTKRKHSGYGKLSDLISEEDKAAIEKQYSVDMSRVRNDEVSSNFSYVNKKIQCNICKVLYTRLDKCQVHIWRHLDMKPYLCKSCDFSTLTVSSIRCHIRKTHLKLKPYECKVCSKRYNTYTQLEEHLNIHTGDTPYHCDMCEVKSRSKQLLIYHLAKHKEVKDVFCEHCGKAFLTKGRLRAHLLTHNKDKAFKCTLCSAYLVNQEALDRHYKNVHARDYVCKICSKVYKSRKALHNHGHVHSEAKYKCTLCPNIYKSSHILKEHLLKHQGIRQYRCKECGKDFGQQSHLAAHMAVHSGITYNCPGCDKGFNRHDNMKVHTKRCNLFLANPDLKELLVKRKITVSKNSTARAERKRSSNIANAGSSSSSSSSSNSSNSSLNETNLPPKKRKNFKEETLHSSYEFEKCPKNQDFAINDNSINDTTQEEPIIVERILAPVNF